MKLGKYKNLHAKQPDLTVSESEIDKVLKNKQHEYAVVRNTDDRGALSGDEAVLDYQVECGGQTVPGSQCRNYPLLLGSHTFVPGFEDAVIGHMPGEHFDVSVTFPANYRMPSLAGKDAVFHVHLKALRVPEYQPIDDDFARDFSEFDSLMEWRDAIREQIQARRESSAYEKLSRELLAQIIADSKIPIDEDLKQELSMEFFEDFLDELDENGMNFETYCKRSGLTKKQIRQQQEEKAVRCIAEQSVLHAVANKEHLSVSAEELADELYELALDEGEDPDVFAEMLDDEEIESISDQLLLNKAMEFILSNAVLE